MIAKTKLILLLVCIAATALAQNAFYKAQTLYTLEKSGQPVDPSTRKFFDDPFNAQVRSAEANSVPGLALGGSSIPASYQSMAIDAVAKIIAEDFQEGMTILYINKFKERLDLVPELRVFFPATYQLFVDTNPFDYPKLGADFRARFEDDLRLMVPNLKSFMDTVKAKPWSTFRTSKYYIPYSVASDIGGKLISGTHPAEILDYLELSYKGKDTFMSYYKAIRMANIIQRNFQKATNPQFPPSTEPTRLWVQFKDLKNLADDPQKIIYVMALIYQEDPELFSSLLPDTQQEAVLNVYNQVVRPSIELLMIIDNISQKSNLSGEDLGQMLDSVLALLKKYSDATRLIPDQISFSRIATKLSQCHTAVARKDYASLVSNLVYIINEINAELAGQQTPAALKVSGALLKYGTFATDVVNAKSSDDLKAAYRKASAGRGTFMDKRFSLSSLTVSAHPGVVGGVEQLSGTSTWNANVGITAPIGLEFTWGRRGKYDKLKPGATYVGKSSLKTLKGSNWGIFLGVADVGAVFNYRLKDKDSELPEELTFKQVFSPGAALHYGFKNSPIVLGAGVQYTPELRKLDTTLATTAANSTRVFARLTYDLPLLKIYYKKERKK